MGRAKSGRREKDCIVRSRPSTSTGGGTGIAPRNVRVRERYKWNDDEVRDPGSGVAVVLPFGWLGAAHREGEKRGSLGVMK